MSIEGTYVYACPLPPMDEKSAPVYPVVYPDVQSLIDTIAKQREEIEAYKSAITLMKGYMTEQQLLSLSYMAQLLTEGK